MSGDRWADLRRDAEMRGDVMVAPGEIGALLGERDSLAAALRGLVENAPRWLGAYGRWARDGDAADAHVLEEMDALMAAARSALSEGES